MIHLIILSYNPAIFVVCVKCVRLEREEAAAFSLESLCRSQAQSLVNTRAGAGETDAFLT